MNNHFENHFTANHGDTAASSVKDGTARVRRGALNAAKRWVSYLPLRLTSPHRKPKKRFSGMQHKMSTLLAKLTSSGTRNSTLLPSLKDLVLTPACTENMLSRDSKNGDRGEEAKTGCSTNAEKGALAITPNLDPRPNNGVAPVAEGK